MSVQVNEMPSSDALRSPNAIPPRTSSSGQFNVSQPPQKGVLKPVSEADWIAGQPLRKRTTTASSSALRAAATIATGTPALGGAGGQVPGIEGAGTGGGHDPALNRASGSAGHDRDPSAHIGDDLINQTRSLWSPEKEKILFGPFDYLFAHPGKDIRSQLIAAFNAWLKVPPESLAIITKVVGMLHTASLLYSPLDPSPGSKR